MLQQGVLLLDLSYSFGELRLSLVKAEQIVFAEILVYSLQLLEFVQVGAVVENEAAGHETEHNEKASPEIDAPALENQLAALSIARYDSHPERSGGWRASHCVARSICGGLWLMLQARW